MIVVTGACGFIGRALVTTLRAQGQPVVGVARSMGADRQVLSYDAVPHGETLVHLAETANVGQAEREGDQAADERAALFSRIVGRFKRVLFVSSGVVYGDETNTPRRPDEPVHPRGAYTRGKLLSEAVALAAGGVVARLGNVYGAPLTPGTVLADLLAACQQPGPVRVRSLTSIRDYVHVDDCVRGLTLLLAHPPSGIVNVATGTGTSVAQLVQMVLQLRGETGREVEETAPHPRTSTLVLDIAETRLACGYVPQISLPAGLAPLVHRSLEKT